MERQRLSSIFSNLFTEKREKNYRIHHSITREEVFELTAPTLQEALRKVRTQSSLYLTEVNNKGEETRIVEWEDESNEPF